MLGWVGVGGWVSLGWIGSGQVRFGLVRLGSLNYLLGSVLFRIG